ncbi:MAG: hypothetical protein KAH32_07765 [Chlamydiia bacterium]|nr:hypothetical protein [Chlamydiia bacterium]
MIYLDDVQAAVNSAYKTLAKLQYIISVREPVSGETSTFDKMYTLSTKLLANLEYLNMLKIHITFEQNKEIENIITSLKEITIKVKNTWD